MHAVRGVDLRCRAGRDGRPAQSERCREADDDLLLGLQDPNAGSASVFGASPRHAVASGRVGAMLQSGSLIRDLTVRELVAMGASLYPSVTRRRPSFISLVEPPRFQPPGPGQMLRLTAAVGVGLLFLAGPMVDLHRSSIGTPRIVVDMTLVVVSSCSVR